MVKLRIPARQIKYGVKQPTPYQLIVETQHVLNRDDSDFINSLKAELQKIINMLNSHKTEQVFKYDDTKFGVGIVQFKWFNTPVTLKIFIAISPNMEKLNGMDFINVPDNNIAGYQDKDVFPKFTPLTSQSSVNQVISIFGMVSAHLVEYYSDFKEEVIGVIKHELLHALHYKKQPALNINAGVSYEYANDLLFAYKTKKPTAKLEFPTLDELNKIHRAIDNYNVLSHTNIILILSACIYYLDDSESLAWIESFNGESLAAVRINNYFPKDTLLTMYNQCESYNIFNSLFNLIVSYRKNIIDAVNSDSFLKQYITRYFKICKQTSQPTKNIQDIPSRRIQHILDSWEVKAHKFLRKAVAIHKRNVEKFSYPAQ